MHSITVFFLFFIATFHLWAYGTDGVVAPPYRLTEIVVSPFKGNKEVREMPVAVSQVSAMSLQNQHLQDTKALSGFLPNLFLPDYGSKYTSPVFIRGIGSKNGSPVVGLHVDGIPYGTPSAFDMELQEVERVEVYRGPQGPLFGKNAMGGMISVTTRSPLKYSYTSFRAEGGMYGHYQASAAHYGKFSEHCGYVVSGKYLHEGGCFDKTFKGEKADRTRVGVVRARLEWLI